MSTQELSIQVLDRIDILKSRLLNIDRDRSYDMERIQTLDILIKVYDNLQGINRDYARERMLLIDLLRDIDELYTDKRSK